MGWYVHLQVSFSCSYNEPIAEIAKKHLFVLDFESCPEVEWFLRDLTKRTGINPGPKGGLSLWGVVGNYTNVELFCNILIPFWKEIILEDGCGGHIIIFEEQEQSNKATAYEIYLNEQETDVLVVKHICPFCWNQM